MAFPKGFNQVILMGNCGKDPVYKNNRALLSVATEYSVKKDDGSYETETEWTRVVCFGRQAEVARDYLRKGSQVHIVGRLHTNKWQDETSGQTRYITEVIVNELRLIGGKSQDGGHGQDNSGGGEYRQEYRQQPSPPPLAPPQYAPPPLPPGVPPPPPPKTDKFDDDIPF